MLKKFFMALLGLLLVAVAGFLIWASIYYEADEVALQVYQAGLDSGHIVVYDNLTVIEPVSSIDIGIVFYPGAKVEAIAYIPLLQQLADVGFIFCLTGSFVIYPHIVFATSCNFLSMPPAYFCVNIFFSSKVLDAFRNLKQKNKFIVKMCIVSDAVSHHFDTLHMILGL